MIYLVDRDYRYWYFNHSYANLIRSKYAIEIEIGRNLFDCISDPNIKEKLKIDIDKALNGETQIEQSNDKKYRYETTYTPIWGDLRDVRGVISFTILMPIAS